MKKQLLVLVFFGLAYFTGNAQTKYLYATTTSGGLNASGTILAANDDGTGFHTAYNFVNATGAYPVGKMVQAQDGKLYGCTYLGGYDDSCCIFNYDPVSGAYNMLYQFMLNTALGELPYSGLTMTYDGMLYGVTSYGGANGNGTIFSFNPATSTYTDIFDFTDATGGNGMSELLATADGNLYGVTSTGGTNSTGTIFSFNRSNSNLQVLYNFPAAGGSVTHAAIIMATDGNLYGTTSAGGVNNFGNIYRLNPNTQVYTDVFDFSESTGAPVNGLVQAGDGRLYGATYNVGGLQGNGGFIYNYNPINGNFVYATSELTDGTGDYPTRALTATANGMLYGAGMYGGSSASGAMFSFNISTQTVTKLLDLDGTTLGGFPDGSVVEVNGVCSPITSQFSASVCSGLGYHFNGNEYSLAGAYTNTFVSANGCDSMVTLNLTVNNLPEVGLTIDPTPICVGQKISLNGGTPYGGTYSGADVSGNLFTATDPGTYVVTYTFTDANNCTNTSTAVVNTQSCTTTTGITAINGNDNSLDIFPQPASGTLNIASGLIDQSKIEMKIYDISGRIVSADWQISAGKISVDVSALAAGAYVVNLQSGAGEASGRFMVK